MLPEHEPSTRRRFLGGVSCAAAAAAGIAGREALAGEPAHSGSRRVVGGSPNPAYSRAVEFNGLVYVAGVVGSRPGTGVMPRSFDEQCRQAMENLKTAVEDSGSRMASVLRCSCYLTDAEDFPAFNDIFRSYFPSDPPARSTVVVKALVVPGGKLEIDCVTCLPA